MRQDNPILTLRCRKRALDTHQPRSARQISSFIQNKPNSQNAEMNITSCSKKYYEMKNAFSLPENKPNQTQFQTRGNAKIHPRPTPSRKRPELLHQAILQAFDREGEHLYSFFVPTCKMGSRLSPHKLYDNSIEYAHPLNYQSRHEPAVGFMSMFLDMPQIHKADQTTIASLSLVPRRKLYCLFDFGDSWWHELTVEQTDGVADE